MKIYLIRLLVKRSPLTFLCAAIEALGWDAAIPEGKDEDVIPGLITGNDEYISKILDALEVQKEYDNKCN